MCSKIEKLNKRTKKNISKDEKGNISFDAHAWVVDRTTNEIVFDPDFKEYEEIRKKYGLTDERCYKPISKYHSKIIWNYVRFNSIYPYLRINKKSLTKYENTYLSCFINAYVYQKRHPNTKIVIGSFGWKYPNGEIYWQFGK